MTLRENLNPLILAYTSAIDQYSKETVVSGTGQEHYIALVKRLEDLKTYIIENERKNNEELRIPSRSNGRLHQETNDSLETSSGRYTSEERYQFVRSNS